MMCTAENRLHLRHLDKKLKMHMDRSHWFAMRLVSSGTAAHGFSTTASANVALQINIWKLKAIILIVSCDCRV